MAEAKHTETLPDDLDHRIRACAAKHGVYLPPKGYVYPTWEEERARFIAGLNRIRNRSLGTMFVSA